MRTAPANIWDSAGSHCHVCDIRRVMLHLFKRTKKNVESLSKPSIGEERRVYAIGDIHGRLDLFDQLLELIYDDSMERGNAELQIILLGVLIDRGPNSAGVVTRAAGLAEATGAVRFLKGNHEEVFLQAAKRSEERRGGKEWGGKCKTRW